MTILGIVTIVTTILLYRLIFTNWVCLIGFRLPAALVLALVGALVTVWTNPWYLEWTGITVVWHRVNMTQIYWLIPSWLVLLTPFDAKIKKQLEGVGESIKRG
jgi:hypothetical protein